MKMVSDDLTTTSPNHKLTWKFLKIQFFGGIVKPLMATWPFVINVKGGEKIKEVFPSRTKGSL